MVCSRNILTAPEIHENIVFSKNTWFALGIQDNGCSCSK